VAQPTYERQITGLIVIDPYNDFISEGGKIWDRIKGVAEGNQCNPRMVQVLLVDTEALEHQTDPSAREAP
jgi:ureidoacrylate peracid hydrolase